MGKRGNGEGTIYYSEKLSRWVGQAVLGVQDNGKMRRKSVYGKTRKECKDKLLELQTSVVVDKSNVTVYEVGKNLLEKKHNANIIRDGTYNRDLATLEHIKKSIGYIEVQKVTPNHIQKFLNSKKDYAPSTLKKFSQMLNQIFIDCIKKDIITKNPMQFIIKPKSNKLSKEVDALTINEQKDFLKFAENDYYRLPILIAFYSGMRIGEVLALTPNDIDFKNELIHITNSLTRNTLGRTIIGDRTKTYEGLRDIPITIVLKPLLDESIANYTTNTNNLLFINPNKKLIEVSTINSHIKRICKKANIKVQIKPTHRKRNGKDVIYNEKTSLVSTHVLRHTYATRCIEAGVPIEVLQKLLGHKDISVTINTYTTIFDKYKKDSLNLYIDYIKNL